jgi:hypothetical protein
MQAIAVQRMRIQVQLVLQPRQRGVARPCQVVREVLHHALDLARDQRHQQQQCAGRHQHQHDEHDAHGQRAAHAVLFQSIGQRIAEIGQHPGDRERHDHRRQQPDQPDDDGRDRQQLPATRSVWRKIVVHGQALGCGIEVSPMRRVRVSVPDRTCAMHRPADSWRTVSPPAAAATRAGVLPPATGT